MTIDWLDAAGAERRLLYRYVKQAIDRSGSGWDAAFRKAFGKAVAMGAGYLDNFRAGKIARGRAQTLYDWLRLDHPALAEALERDIRALYDAGPEHGPWEDFLTEYGLFDRVLVRWIEEEPRAPRKQATTNGAYRSRIEARPVKQNIDVRIPLNTPFTFQIDSPVDGYAVALQWARGVWSLMPLSPADPGIPVKANAEASREAPGIVLSRMQFEEHRDVGLHCLVFLVTPQEENLAEALGHTPVITAAALELVADHLRALPRHQWAVLRLNAAFLAQGDGIGGTNA